MKQINCAMCGELIYNPKTSRKYCDVCRKERKLARARRWYNENLERGRSYFRNWKEKNREVYLENRRKKYAENPEKHIAATIEWGKNNPEKKAENQKKWKLRNPERYQKSKKQSYWKNRETHQEYYEKNKEHIRKIKKTWIEKNRQRVRRKNLHREAMKQNAEGFHTAEQFLILCDEYKWKCAYCGCDLNEKTITEDHMIPLSKGGSDDLSNIVPACKFCNSSKCDKTAKEYLKSIKKDLKIA